MSLVVNNLDISSPIAQRSPVESPSSLDEAKARLEPRFKGSSASNDRTGFAIMQRINAQINGLRMAAKNANEGISLTQSVEGTIVEVSGMMQRLQDLSVQTTQETNTATERAFLRAEVNLLIAEIKRISNDTLYKIQKALKPSAISEDTLGRTNNISEAGQAISHADYALESASHTKKKLMESQGEPIRVSANAYSKLVIQLLR